jgi:hypothetical protein
MDQQVNDEIRGHLQMIEYSYDVIITNKDEICRWIGDATHNHREILTVTLALNNWVAASGSSGRLTIDRSTLERIIASTVGRW